MGSFVNFHFMPFSSGVTIGAFGSCGILSQNNKRMKASCPKTAFHIENGCRLQNASFVFRP